MRTYHVVIEHVRGKGAPRRVERVERDIEARDITAARHKLGVRETRGAQSVSIMPVRN